MMTEDVAGNRRAYFGSYFGLLLGWIGLLVIAAGMALALRELKVYAAAWHVLRYWASAAVAATAGIYAVAMFVLTFSFARRIDVQILPALAFAVWGAIPALNLLPFVLLLLLAARRGGRTPAAAA